MRVAYPDLFAALKAGSTVVAPTSLLASVAQEQFSRAKLLQGLTAWERPPIYSLESWLEICWREARFGGKNVPALLSRLQERQLWRRMIEEDRPDLFDPSSMANMASRSAQILAEHNIPLDLEDWAEREDARQFQSWLRKIRAQCAGNGWMIRSDLWRMFPERRPFTVSPVVPVKKVEAIGFDSLEHEMEYAAQTARSLVEAGETSVAVFVPELSRNAGLLKRTFNGVFDPGGVAEFSAFHLNTHPLEKEPVIASALLLLSLAKPRIDHAVAGAIIRSPFIAGAKEERSARALSDISLRRARELDVTLGDMMNACRSCPILSAVFRAVGAFNAPPGPQSPSSWSRLFSKILGACEWPGLDNGELVSKWHNALSSVSTLGLVRPEIDMETALGRLREILSQPVRIGDWPSPVQILDSTSAHGLEFDHAIVMGLSEESFLKPAPTSPLLPFALQRRFQVTSGAELREVSVRALFQSAGKIRATFSKELPPSLKPLVKGTPKRWKASKLAFKAADLQQIDDGTAPPLAASAAVRGGASIIKAQSQCPFKAFAEYRLNASRPEDACFGYDARDRGRFTHKALEFVWKDLGTQAKLQSLNREELRGIVKSAVLTAVKSVPEAGLLHELASLAEQERLEILILNWLDIEKARQKSFTVEHIEEKRYYEAPGLRLDLRVDRIDRLANGSVVLIDYKTGKQTKNKLEGSRPKEPQLLVYAAALQEPIEGLMFGELTADQPRLVGHALGRHAAGQSVKDHKNNWDEFLDEARQTVSTLAGEFVAGVAIVRPERGACAYCTTASFCRINESAHLEEDDD